MIGFTGPFPIEISYQSCFLSVAKHFFFNYTKMQNSIFALFAKFPTFELQNVTNRRNFAQMTQYLHRCTQ